MMVDMRRPSVGDEMNFTPFGWDQFPNRGGGGGFALFGGGKLSIPTQVTGTVVLVNRLHGWFRVRYRASDGTVCHECFRIEVPPSKSEPEFQIAKLRY